MKNNIIKGIISVVLGLIVSGVAVWTMSIPLNTQNVWFYFVILIFLAIVLMVFSFLSIFIFDDSNEIISAMSLAPIGLAILFVVVLLIIGLSGSKLFHSDTYANQLTMKEGNFEKDLAISEPSMIPTIDKKMSVKLGNRTLGGIVELVSQFDVASDYTQIVLEGESVRVSPLEYSSLFKWFKNHKDGIPYYVTVDMITGKSELVNLDKPIRYSHNDKFSRNITRHIFLNNPKTIFDEPTFEVSDLGEPYYVASILESKAGLFGAKDVTGAFVVSATTGEITRYKLKDIPEWVDRVYSSDLVMEQINNNGGLQLGYMNSVFGQKGVTQNAEDYNYIAMNGDLFLYTGLTSVANDESNIGFTLVNSRTKEAKKYDISTSTEWSAMDSAEGSVQEKGYESTFPLLVNIENKPVYMLSLKDSAGLIKMYAFVDATNYQKVGLGNTLEQAWDSYSGGKAVAVEENSKVEEEIDQESIEIINGEIEEIATSVINGESKYFIKLKDNDTTYTANISDDFNFAFLKVKDVVEFQAIENKVLKLNQ